MVPDPNPPRLAIKSRVLKRVPRSPVQSVAEIPLEIGLTEWIGQSSRSNLVLRITLGPVLKCLASKRPGLAGQEKEIRKSSWLFLFV
jgi:hypothetical protein